MANENEIKKWQDRLTETFRGAGGCVGERLSAVLAAEGRYEVAAIENTHGFTTLLDSFQDFFIQTFDEMRGHEHRKNINVCAILVASWSRLRHAMQGFYRGYPYDAAASIRALFENAFFLGAAINGIVKPDDQFSFANSIDFASTSTAEVFRVQRKHLGSLTNIIREEMHGAKSGLSTTDQIAIDELLRSLHGHVHRTESSIAMLIVESVKTNKLPELLPRFDLRRSLHFAAPMAYACWLLFRVLPFVSSFKDYSSVWRHRYSILDESFREWVRLNNGSTGEAFCRMVDNRFNFDAKTGWANVRVEPTTQSGPSSTQDMPPC